MKKKLIETAEEAIQALGGAVKVSDLLGIDYRAVTNWPERGMPPNTYASLGRMLSKRGYKFGLDLFQQRPIVNRRVWVRPVPKPKQAPPPSRPAIPFRRP